MSMAARTVPRGSLAGLVTPGVLLLALLLAIGFQSGLVRRPDQSTRVAGPETSIIAPHAYSYRATGDYQRDGVPVDGPLVAVTDPVALTIMTYQVSAADFRRCVADGACRPAEPRRRVEGNVPVTGVSFDDAEDYARWLSVATGETWRLPTVAEWAFAAGSKAVDIVLEEETDAANPAERWIAYYEKEAALGAGAAAPPQPLGSFGVNEFGVADLGGSVWEWTSTCGGRTTLGSNGEILTQIKACGVRYLEGAHRTAMSRFIRDGRSGGCAVGAPPDNLGFRLVRDPQWYEGLFRLFQ